MVKEINKLYVQDLEEIKRHLRLRKNMISEEINFWYYASGVIATLRTNQIITFKESGELEKEFCK